MRCIKNIAYLKNFITFKQSYLSFSETLVLILRNVSLTILWRTIQNKHCQRQLQKLSFPVCFNFQPWTCLWQLCGLLLVCFLWVYKMQSILKPYHSYFHKLIVISNWHILMERALHIFKIMQRLSFLQCILFPKWRYICRFTQRTRNVWKTFPTGLFVCWKYYLSYFVPAYASTLGHLQQVMWRKWKYVVSISLS